MPSAIEASIKTKVIRQWLAGKKYCRKCEIYLYHEEAFCPCCRAQLRTTAHNKKRIY